MKSDLLAWCSMVLVAFALTSLLSSADIAFAQDGSAEEAPEKQTFRGVLPPYYAQVVSPLQRRDIYAIQAEYEKEIQELEKQIAALELKRDKEIEELLYPEQLTELERIRSDAAAEREKRQQEEAAKKPVAKSKAAAAAPSSE